MAEKITMNHEYKFILIHDESGEEYDLGLAESIQDSWTTTTTDVNRFKYGGVVAKIPTSSTFAVTVTGINDENDETYKLFKKLYGGSLADLQGYTLKMEFPQVEGETTYKVLTCPATLSFDQGFSASANDMSNFSITINAAGAITSTDVTPPSVKNIKGE